MTLIKFRILCLLVSLAIYIPAIFFLPVHIVNIILWPIAGWHIGGWIAKLTNKLADRFGYTE